MEIDTQALREHFNMCGITLESNIRPEDLSFTKAKKMINKWLPDKHREESKYYLKNYWLGKMAVYNSLYSSCLVS